MRLALVAPTAIALAALGLAASAFAQPTGPALGQALVKGEVDPMTFDFGALRYAPGNTLGFLGAQSAAQLAAAKAHDKPTWQAVLDASVCAAPAERMAMAGFDSALLAPDAATWSSEKAAADEAFARYIAARDTVLAGQPAPYPEFRDDENTMRAAAQAKAPELKALYTHTAAGMVWRHALVFGPAKAYAGKLGAPGRAWLNARVMTEGCRTDQANNAWLKTALATVPWFDIKTYGPGADKAAWILAQHADSDPALQNLTLERMGAAVIDHNAHPGNFAYLWDRVALHAGRPQRYGTQMRCVGKVWTPILPLEDASKLDERRRWAGLPSEAEYIRAAPGACGG